MKTAIIPEPSPLPLKLQDNKEETIIGRYTAAFISASKRLPIADRERYITHLVHIFFHECYSKGIKDGQRLQDAINNISQLKQDI